MRFSIKRHQGSDQVVLDGDLVDGVETDLIRLKQGLTGPLVIFDCAGIARINSVGVVLWRKFIEDVQQVHRCEFVECSASFLGYLAMLPAFVGKGSVRSFHFPLSCRTCRRHGEVIVATDDMRRTRSPPALVCPGCGTPMTPDLDVDDLLLNVFP